MIILVLAQRTLIASTKPLKQILQQYRGSEQVGVINDVNNADAVIEKTAKQYRVQDVVRDYTIKRQVTRTVSAETRQRMSEAAKKRRWSEEVKAKIAASRKGQANHRMPHGWESKMMISESMKGNQNAKGLKWCYDPVSLQEHRVNDVPYNLAPRRPPFSISKYR